MTRVDDELDEYGKRALAPLRPTPPLDPATADKIKASYLKQAESIRQADFTPAGVKSAPTSTGIRGVLPWLPRPILKTLAALMLVLVFVLAGSSLSVYAAQDSLPGQTLYPVKLWTEDLSLSFAQSPQTKLNLTLVYTTRRMDEISALMAHGKSVNMQTSERFQHQLEDALQLAVQLDDQQMLGALIEIKKNAENQGITLQDLINQLPAQAEPATIQLQQRLTEQVQLSNMGETDPSSFREKVQERARNRQQIKHNSATEQPQNLPDISSTTATPGAEQDHQGSTPTEKQPGSGGPGNGQASPGNGQIQPTSDDGNHSPEPEHTPKP